MPKFKTKYSNTSDLHAAPFVSDKPSKTDKSYGFDTDINNIVAGYPVRMTTRNYGEVNGKFMTPDDYQNSLYKLAQAKSQFEELPSKLRQRFHNDPKVMLEFLADEKNDAEAIKLGLKQKVEKTQPVKVEIVTSGEVTQSTPAGTSEV